MGSRILACAADALAEEGFALVDVPGIGSVAVFRVDSEFYAIEDRCSHQKARLSDGWVEPESCAVECPIHASLFDLRTGRPSNLPAVQPVRVFGTVVEDGSVYVEIDP